MQSVTGEEGDHGGTGLMTPVVVMLTTPGDEEGISRKRAATSPLTSAAKKASLLGNEGAPDLEQGHPPVDNSHKDASTMNDQPLENNPWKTRRIPRFPAQTKTLRRYKNVPTLSTPENVLSCDDLITEMHSIIENVNVPTDEMREIAKLRDEMILSRHQMKDFMTVVVNMFKALNDKLEHMEADAAMMKEGN